MALLLGHHNPRGVATISICVVFGLLAFAATSLRLWARRLKKTGLCFNDYAIFVALMFAEGLVITVILGPLIGGFGRHVQSLTPAELVIGSKITVAAEIIWVLANSSVKISVLHFYTTIFSFSSFNRAARLLTALVILYTMATILIAFLICHPFAYNWNKAIKGSCAHEKEAFLAVGLVNLVLDLTIIALPIPKLWDLQLAFSRKIWLTGIFSLGLTVCIISALRISSLQMLDFADWPYAAFGFVICSILEPCLGIINACLLTMQPVISKVTVLRRQIMSRWSTHKDFLAGPDDALQLTFTPGSERTSHPSKKNSISNHTVESQDSSRADATKQSFG